MTCLVQCVHQALGILSPAPMRRSAAAPAVPQRSRPPETERKAVYTGSIPVVAFAESPVTRRKLRFPVTALPRVCVPSVSREAP